MFQVLATVTKTTPEGSVVTQVPTFFLDGNIQGIVSLEHADQIAQEIINPTGTENIRVSTFIARVE